MIHTLNVLMRKYVDLYCLLSLRSSLADRCVALVDIETIS